jgi:SAM-dependent methyltransferase
MVERARGHIARLPGLARRAEFREEDAADLSFPAGSFDAVVEFGILHHVPPWRGALGEVARVLRPGGSFAFEDLTRAAVDAQPWFDHPPEGRFSAAEFRRGIEGAGLSVRRFRTLGPWALRGVAGKPPGPRSVLARAQKSQRSDMKR